MKGIGLWAAAFVLLLAASSMTGLALVIRTSGVAWIAVAFGAASTAVAVVSLRIRA